VWVEQSEYIVVGAALAAARERARLTQQEIARRLRKPQSFVSSYELGQRRVDILELFRIVEALSCDPIEIVEDIMHRAKVPIRRRRSRV